MTRTRHKPNGDRLVELAQQIIDEHLSLGPLDREDLREALCELIELRNRPAPIGETREIQILEVVS